jgi:hypothetical protein
MRMPPEGFAASLAHPGGNITGFTQFEYSMSGKWLELLKQIVPRVTRVAVILDRTAREGLRNSPLFRRWRHPLASSYARSM